MNMKINKFNNLSLPIVLLLSVLPGAALSILGDLLVRKQFLTTIASAPSIITKLPPWEKELLVPYSLYYIVGILLGFIFLSAVDILFKFSPALSKIYNNILKQKWGWIVFGDLLGGMVGISYLIMFTILSIQKDLIIVGFIPASATRWWLIQRGYWPVARKEGNRSRACRIRFHVRRQ